MKILYILAGLFLLTELIILFRKKHVEKNQQASKDRKSLLLFWLLIPTSITAAFMFSGYERILDTIQALSFAGVFIALTGLIIRCLAIKQLQDKFTVNVRLVDDHQLITTGLYGLVRHPAYLGLWLFAFGLGLAMNSWWSLSILVVAFSVAIYYRIFVEEQVLNQAFGKVYEDYSRYTPKLFPFPKL